MRKATPKEHLLLDKVDELNDSIKMLKAKLEEAQEARAQLISARASLQRVMVTFLNMKQPKL